MSSSLRNNEDQMHLPKQRSQGDYGIWGALL